MGLIDTDKLNELIDDDIASLNKNMSREGYDVCLCTLQMVKLYIKALPTVEPIKMMCNGEHIKCPAHKDYKRGCADGYAMCLIDFDKDEPTKHGRWVVEPDATIMHCNICGWAFEYYSGLEEEWNNCPHCGALMDEMKE